MSVTAQRVRTRIANILDFAAAAGYRSGLNPARWKGHREHLLGDPEKLAKTEHHAALPFSELPILMKELRDIPGIAARALIAVFIDFISRGVSNGVAY
jgi:hypothetical protein